MEKQIDPETTGKPAGICLLKTEPDEFKKVPFFMTFSLFEKEKPFQFNLNSGIKKIPPDKSEEIVVAKHVLLIVLIFPLSR